MKTEMKSLKTTLDSLLTKQAVLSYQYKDALRGVYLFSHKTPHPVRIPVS